ncbi:MAG: transcriptional antiterminator, Rof [Gammaproteobacteria bacterium]|nr:transcriptional antiterminator, Rof [Gammaproteobacteria bacterium]
MPLEPAYRPVSCALHSELELAIMRQTRLRLSTAKGEISGRPLDLLIREGAEYLLLQDDHGQEHSLRLDQIQLTEIGAQ